MKIKLSLAIGAITLFSALTAPSAPRLAQAQQAAQKKTAPTEANVKYGDHPRNVLDFWKADSTDPAPVLIFFHGGGFVSGDKSAANADVFLRMGISVVSANYRFIQGPNSESYPGPMLDGARVVQFVRSKAQDWNIDPDRVALSGGSAGAIISMWIAYRDDMAASDSQDPVLRQSTRVSCIAPVAGPTTLDPEFIRAAIGGNPIVHPVIRPLFGAQTEEELKTPEKRRLIVDASPITHATADDPPTFLLYSIPMSETPLPPDTDINTSIHHPKFGLILKEKLDELGVENEIAYPGDGHTPTESILALTSFLKKHLMVK